VSLFQRIFGGGGAGAGRDEAGDTETVRRIAGRLDGLPPERRTFVAAFAYVLVRVAQADLKIEESESRTMERVVAETSGLGAAEAALAVEIAKSQARLSGGVDNYTVTREFRRVSTPEERLALLDCLYAVAAADDTVTNLESTEIAAIAEELGLTQADITAIRSRYRDKLGVLRRGLTPT
jgi:uncharacterized tellurite resistance protein B-like protein